MAVKKGELNKFIILSTIGAIVVISIIAYLLYSLFSSDSEIVESNINITIIGDSVFLDQSLSELTLNVKRNEGAGNLVGIKFIVEDSGGKRFVDREELIFYENEEKEFVFRLYEVSLTELKTVTAIPVIKIDNEKEELADKSSIYYFETQSVTTIPTPNTGTDPTPTPTIKPTTGGGGGGGGGGSGGGDTPPPTQTCGNNVKEGSEICDGTSLNGEDCMTQGYDIGTLSCNSNCLSYDISNCSNIIVSNPDLVLYLPMNNNLEDMSTYNNDGFCNSGNCPSYGLGGDGSQTLNYDGINSAVFVKHNSSLKFGTGDFSAMAWIKVRSADNSAGERILNDRGQGALNLAGWQLKIKDDAGLWGFYDSEIVENNDYVGCVNGFCGNLRWNYNEWHHVAMTYNNSNDVMRIYVDGILVYTDNTVSGGDGVITNISNNLDFVVGASMYNAGVLLSSPQQLFDGFIDKVKLYNRVLSLTEIETEYENYLVPICGDGNIDDGEVCDDSDQQSGDGCSSSCQIESGWTCSGQPSVCTEIRECNDDLDNDGDGEVDMADAGCSSTTDNDETNCGDGVCEGGETSGSCSSDCGTPLSRCGNAIIDTASGELCDDGRGNGVCPSTCSSSCTFNSCSTSNQIHYVTPSGSGTKSGNDWNNAMAKSVLLSAQRGHTYYLADGDYLSQDIFQANSGTAYIYVIKATSNNPYVNSKAGWNNELTNGVSIFDQVRFRNSNIVFDGAIGGGPGSWKSGHGFYVDGTDGSDPINIPSGFSPSSIRISHTEVEGDLSVNDGSNDLIYINSPSPVYNWKFNFLHLHDTGRTWFIWRHVNNAILEYSYMARGDSSAAQHGNGISSHMGSDNIIRYSIFEDATGTSAFTWGGAETTDDDFSHNTTYVTGPGYLDDHNCPLSCFDPRGPQGDRWQIYGNIFFDNALPGGRGQGILSDWSERISNNNSIYNNDFYKLRGEQNDISFSSWHANVSTKVYNNIFYDIDNSGSPDTTFAVTIRDYNAFDNNIANRFDPTPLNSNEQLISSNPFVNPSPMVLNFSLTIPNSINPGVQQPWMDPLDMYGNVRGADGKWDRGAIEYVGSPQPSPLSYKKTFWDKIIDFLRL